LLRQVHLHQFHLDRSPARAARDVQPLAMRVFRRAFLSPFDLSQFPLSSFAVQAIKAVPRTVSTALVWPVLCHRLFAYDMDDRCNYDALRFF
jgi:hypothetical protein